MTKQKVDGVIEAVRYANDGRINDVRLYEKRGLIFADNILMNRDELLDQLKHGSCYYTGTRTEKMANHFDLHQQVKLINSSKREIITKGSVYGNNDLLEKVPLF